MKMNISTDIKNIAPQKSSVTSHHPLAKISDNASGSQKNNSSEIKQNNPEEIKAQVQESKVELEKAMDIIKEKSKDMNFGLDMKYDERINRVIARIIDKETGNVIKEIPPEEIIKIAVMVNEMSEGMFLDDQA
jgi:flagellar protein FlaG